MGVVRRRVLRCRNDKVTGIEDDLLDTSAEHDLVIIGEGTHHLKLERNRMQMFREVQSFLNHEGHEGHKEGHA